MTAQILLFDWLGHGLGEGHCSAEDWLSHRASFCSGQWGGRDIQSAVAQFLLFCF